MFNAKSDYALNKRDQDTIIYQTALGPILLTRSDFDNEVEFRRWKDWSDQNYHQTEQANRPSEEHLLWDDYAESTAVLLDFRDEAHCSRVSAKSLQIQSFQIAYQYGRRTLTKTQRRRLMLYAHGMTVGEVARAENVPHQDISKSIAAAKRKLIKFMKRL